jgi:hypothetical protein
MSYREAHQHILNNYMLKLSSAPFDTKDEQLLAKAGACGPCPKRTGNQADLFGDVKSADVCTDPKCFDDKRQAHFRVAAADLEAKGFKVIAGDAAKKVLPHWEHSQRLRRRQLHQPLRRLREVRGHHIRRGRSQKVSALFDKDYKPAKLQHPLTGEFLDVVTQQAVTAAAAKKAKASGKAGKSGDAAAARGRNSRPLRRSSRAACSSRSSASCRPPHPAGMARHRRRRADAHGRPPRGNGRRARAAEGRQEARLAIRGGRAEEGTGHAAAWRRCSYGHRSRDRSRLLQQREAGQHREALQGRPAKVKKAIADEANAAAPAKPEKKKGLGRGMPKVTPVTTPLLKGKKARRRHECAHPAG